MGAMKEVATTAEQHGLVLGGVAVEYAVTRDGQVRDVYETYEEAHAHAYSEVGTWPRGVTVAVVPIIQFAPIVLGGDPEEAVIQ